MNALPESAELIFEDSRGIYMPKHFAEQISRYYVHGVAAGDWAVLEAGPEHEWYWDTWDRVLNNAEIHLPIQFTKTIKVWRLYQDGDLWMVPEDAEWPED